MYDKINGQNHKFVKWLNNFHSPSLLYAVLSNEEVGGKKFKVLRFKSITSSQEWNLTLLFDLVCCFTSHSTALVMSGWSVHLTTFFLG